MGATPRLERARGARRRHRITSRESLHRLRFAAAVKPMRIRRMLLRLPGTIGTASSLRNRNVSRLGTPGPSTLVCAHPACGAHAREEGLTRHAGSGREAVPSLLVPSWTVAPFRSDLCFRALENHGGMSGEERWEQRSGCGARLPKYGSCVINRSQASRDLPRMCPSLDFPKLPWVENTHFSFSTPGLSKKSHAPALRSTIRFRGVARWARLGAGRRKRKRPAAFAASLRLRGAEGDRTPDLMHAMHALSQLSYSPNFSGNVR